MGRYHHKAVVNAPKYQDSERNLNQRGLEDYSVLHNGIGGYKIISIKSDQEVEIEKSIHFTHGLILRYCKETSRFIAQ